MTASQSKKNSESHSAVSALDILHAFLDYALPLGFESRIKDKNEVAYCGGQVAQKVVKRSLEL